MSPLSGSCAALVGATGHSMWGFVGSPELGVTCAWGPTWLDLHVCPAGMAFQRSHRLNLLRLVVLLLVALAGIKFLFGDR